MSDGGIRPERRTEEILINLDSTDRFEGTANKFKVSIDRLSNVVSMRVVSVEAPNTNYDIGPDVNRFAIAIPGGGSSVLLLPTGRYTGASLAATLSAFLFPAHGITVSYDAKSNVIILSAVDPTKPGVYTLEFKSDTTNNNIWQILGAPTQDATLQYNAVTEWRSGPLRLRGEHPYILLSIDHLSIVHGNHGVGEPVAAKLTHDNLGSTSQYSVVQSAARRWPHDSPLQPISSFNVSIFNRDGSAYQLDTFQLSVTLFVVRLV
jgi:hypothetical protein